MSAQTLRTLQRETDGLKLLFVDEFSMLGQGDLELLDCHLRKIFDENKAFGGLHIIFTG